MALDAEAAAVKEALGREPTRLSLGGSDAPDDAVPPPAAENQETHDEDHEDDDQPNDADDDTAWRKNKKGEWLTPAALYMRFYRSIRSSLLETIHLFNQPAFSQL